MYEPPVALESTATRIPLENLKARVVVPCSMRILTGFVELASVNGLKKSTGFREEEEEKNEPKEMGKNRPVNR